MPPKPAPVSFTHRINQLFGSNFKMPQASVGAVASWYPRTIGNNLAFAMSGHNAFIKDIPKDFNGEYAKHFALVEAMAMMPTCALIFVHYFSSMLRWRERQNLIAPLQNETAQKIRALHFWLEHIEKKSPSSAPFWRVGLLAMQVTTFPLWLLVAATAPPVFHCALEESNHILVGKYNCIVAKGPPFIATRVQQCEESMHFHQTNALVKTDIAAMFLCFFILYWLIY